MEILIWIGAAISLLGVAGLLACVMMAVRAKSAGLEDAVLRERLKTVVIWNFAALLVSALGLMAVVMGIMLG